MGCLAQKRSDWAFRLETELKNASSASFITLTYDEEHMTLGEGMSGTLLKRDIQLFMKRLRKTISTYMEKAEPWRKTSYLKIYEKRIKYFIAGEYGEYTDRPHYHGIFFNIPIGFNNKEEIEKAWGNGFVHFGYASPKSIRYTAKYIINEVVSICGKEKNFMMCSKGLGIDYVKKMKVFHKRNGIYYGIDGDRKKHLPRYYRDKIFNHHEKVEQRLSDYALKVHQEAMALSEKHKKQGIDHVEWLKQNREQKKNSILKTVKQNQKL